MNKDNSTVSREYDIRCAWKVLTVQPKPEAHIVKGPPNDQFEIRVCPADSAHDPAPRRIRSRLFRVLLEV